MANTRRILVGIHIDDAWPVSTATSAATVAAVYESTSEDFDILLLVDPASATSTDSPPLCHGIPALAVQAPGGAAAAFNRLLAQPADIYVFLENGARPGPDWLTHLLCALDADPSHGMAVPCLNRSWNAQAMAPECAGDGHAVERQSEALIARHGASWRVLAPQDGPADACLVVHRALVDAVGGADDAYGRGPCWELDYAARAACAGFLTVWALASFVHRGPMPARRLADEPNLLDGNKRLFQDRLCGRRHRPADRHAPYHTQCRGTACPDFAPVATTRVRLPLPASTALPSARPLPLVSCTMPTRGRPAFVAQAVAYFHRQDYPHRELVIVYENESDLPPGIAGQGVRLIRSSQRSIGGKRNEAVAAARGEIIAHWDDDDWYDSKRLSRQVRPLVEDVADITGLNGMLFMAIQDETFWAVTRALHRRLFLGNVSGGTLVFRRALWLRSGPYPATSLREDADFMAAAMRDGARLCALPGRELCIYVRHSNNTWKFSEGSYLERSGWLRASAPASFSPDRHFYTRSVPPAAAHRAKRPLVSCIMPTAGRRAFVPLAIDHFLAQDYPERELIVVDDGTDQVADLIPDLPSVRYLRLEQRMTLGAKRNLACEAARGELIAHWDDDDWMSPQWLTSQVETLQSTGADICGLDKVFFYAPETRQAWRYVYDGAQPWVCGGTLCYTRELWRHAQFQAIDVGEDNAFVWNTSPKRVAINARHDLYVATVHRRNTSPKITSARRWHNIPATQVERLMATPSLAQLTLPST